MEKKLNLLILLMSVLLIAEETGAVKVTQIITKGSHGHREHRGHREQKKHSRRTHSDEHVEKMESCQLYEYTPIEGKKEFKFIGDLPYELAIMSFELKDDEKITLKMETYTITFDSSMDAGNPRIIQDVNYRYFSVHGDGPMKIASSNNDNCSATGCAEINGTCLHKDMHECPTSFQEGLCPGPVEIQCCVPSDTGERKMKREEPLHSQKPRQITYCGSGSDFCMPISQGCPPGTVVVVHHWCPANEACCVPDDGPSQPNPSSGGRRKRIVNGALTTTHSHSHMAYLRRLLWHVYCYRWRFLHICWWFWSYDKNRCSGSVIHEKLVLTAAQCTEASCYVNSNVPLTWPCQIPPSWRWFCLTFPVSIRVDLGFDDITPWPASYSVPWFHIVSPFVSMGLFSFSTYDYDVSLLWVAQGIDDRFERVKVPSCNVTVTCREVLMLGKPYNTQPLNNPENRLHMEYQAEIIPRGTCNAVPSLTNRMFCTRKQTPFPDQSVCYGDAGGPVLCNYNQCDYQVGVISWQKFLPWGMWFCNAGDDNVHADLTDPQICDCINTKLVCANGPFFPSDVLCPC